MRSVSWQAVEAAGDRDDLGRDALLLEPHGFLDGDFVERIHRHLDVGGVDAAAVRLHPDFHVVIDDALDGNEDFHRGAQAGKVEIIPPLGTPRPIRFAILGRSRAPEVRRRQLRGVARNAATSAGPPVPSPCVQKLHRSSMSSPSVDDDGRMWPIHRGGESAAQAAPRCRRRTRGSSRSAGATLSLLWGLPFAGLLLSIAIVPLSSRHRSGTSTTASSRGVGARAARPVRRRRSARGEAMHNVAHAIAARVRAVPRDPVRAVHDRRRHLPARHARRTPVAQHGAARAGSGTRKRDGNDRRVDAADPAAADRQRDAAAPGARRSCSSSCSSAMSAALCRRSAIRRCSSAS